MLLQQEGQFNDLSPKLRQLLEEKISGFGKQVRYRFDISHPNPDPTFHNGKILYPNIYTLDPAVWNITDKYEDRQGKQKSKRIALVDGVDDNGRPNKFRKIRVYERDKGIMRLNLENQEDIDIAMAIELHPKLGGGLYSDPTKKQVISRIDETAAAKVAREERSARSKARRAAEELSAQGVIDFADAMMWDSSGDETVLRNQIEELAETSPEFFNELIGGKTIEYQATVKQAMDRGHIEYDPAEDKFTYASNKQTIAILNNNLTGKSHVERLAEWMQTGGVKETAVFKKLKELIKGKELV